MKQPILGNDQLTLEFYKNLAKAKKRSAKRVGDDKSIELDPAPEKKADHLKNIHNSFY